MSKTRSTLIGAGLVAAIALTLPATSAMARGGPSGGFGSVLEFSDLDLNGDGQLTKEELQNQGKARFAKLDADGDGQLSAAELEAAAAERQKDRVSTMIERLDTDKNGTLSEEELQAARDMGGKRMKRDRDGDHGRKHGGKRWGNGKRGDDRREARMERMFDRVDANEDGVISQEEFDAAKAQMMKRSGGRGE